MNNDMATNDSLASFFFLARTTGIHYKSINVQTWTATTIIAQHLSLVSIDESAYRKTLSNPTNARAGTPLRPNAALAAIVQKPRT